MYHNRSVEQTATVEYSILLSATYRVPVLYFGLNNLPPGSPTGIDAVYDYLITEHWRSRLSSVGIMGGISMTVCSIEDSSLMFTCGLILRRTTPSQIIRASSFIPATRQKQ